MLRLALILAALFPNPARAEVRAVLIGVGDYQTLDADLKGPPQDVALLAEVLRSRGVAPSDIQVLGATDTAPTHAAITKALEEVADAAKTGDTVVFYFSGHGAQAPDTSGDEGGGMDEILLPADAFVQDGQVRNALTDDDLHLWARGLLQRGVAVVGLIDACHSNTGFRAVGGAGVARSLTAAQLGLPDSDQAQPQISGNLPADLPGDHVFLFSSQSDQRSFEYPVGTGGVWHGEFTLRLAEALRSLPGASWRQVLTATADAMQQGSARQVPDGEGTLLDHVVFGQAPGSGRFAVASGQVQAGLLQGLVTGSDIALYAQAAGGEPLARTTLAKVDLRRSRLQDAPPAAAGWAEVITRPPPPALRLAPAVRADGQDYSDWIQTLGAGDSGEADLVPILTGGQVALAGPDGVLDPAGPGSTPRIRPEPGEAAADATARVLDQATHSLRLRAVLAGAAGRSLTGRATLSATYDVRTDCGAAPPRPADPATGLHPCDTLFVTVTHHGATPVDLSILYFNADFTIAPIWPQRGRSNRLASGDSARAGLQIAKGSPPALEELFVVAVPVDPDSDRVDLTALADPAVDRGTAGPQVAWFQDRLQPGVTRGFSTKLPLVLLRQPVRITLPP